MNPSIVKHILLPLHERFVGRATFDRWRELERTQWWSRERLRELQLRKLRLLLHHAWAHVPFHRRRLAELGLNPRCVTSLDVLRDLPLMTKQDIRAHRRSLRWPGVPGGLCRYNTGGSTGEPLIFEYDLGRQAYDQAARMRTHRWFGADVGDKEVYLWGSPVELSRQDRLKTFRDRLTNQLLLSAFEMSGQRMDDYIDRIERYDPVSLFGYPSSLALLSRHTMSRGRRPRLGRLGVVFVTGELLYDHQRERIEEAFGVPVANGYGSREGGFIAHECPRGSMHVTSENVILEIVDEAGAAVPAGRTGQIVVTHLDTYGMPFIRYCTGDAGRLADGVCECGRGLELMDVIEGRQTDLVVAADGTVKHALSLIYVLREVEAVRQFQIVQGLDRHLDVHVVSTGELSSEDRSRIEQGLRTRMGPGIDVRIRSTEHIETAASGKYRYVISHARMPEA
ncbi:MAG: phenylacetate--CoA ligase family protein [Phycisphaerae bacterium]|nr:phenylacetate--CoA ligase family protein [Phycisphaerae bacterium]